jgi:two-component system, NarL family, nitrate/nitrite response regulator NarL
MTARISVLVADDHAVVREGLRHLLASDPDLQVVAEATTGEEALAMALEHRPDVVVLDISMPGGNGLDVAPRLREALPETRVVMLSVHDRREYVVQSVRAGASGYLRKDSSPAELRAAVRTVHEGGTFFPPPVAHHLQSGPAQDFEQDLRRAKLALLTARERSILEEVARGATSKEIGERLGISPRTVESHRENIMRKLKIRSVAGLTRFAIVLDLIREK